MGFTCTSVCKRLAVRRYAAVCCVALVVVSAFASRDVVLKRGEARTQNVVAAAAAPSIYSYHPGGPFGVRVLGNPSSVAKLTATDAEDFALFSNLLPACEAAQKCHAEGEATLEGWKRKEPDYLTHFLRRHSAPGTNVVFASVVYYGQDFMMSLHASFMERQNRTAIFVYHRIKGESDAADVCEKYNFTCLDGTEWASNFHCEDVSSTLKTMFTYEAIARGFDVIYSDVDTLWLRPFPIAKWKSDTSPVWVTAYGESWNKCDENALATPGKGNNFGGWCIRSTPVAVGLWRRYRAMLLSKANSLCQDQQTWNERFLQSCNACVGDIKYMNPGCFSHWQRYCNGINSNAMSLPNEEKAISLHMTGFFSPGQKAFWLVEQGIHGYNRESDYYGGKFLYYETNNIAHFDCLLAFAARNNRTLICPLFKKDVNADLYFGLEAMRHTTSSIPGGFEWGFRSPIVYGVYSIRPFSFLRDAYWELRSVKKLAVNDLDVNLRDVSEDLLIIESIEKLAFKKEKTIAELGVIKSWTIPFWDPYGTPSYGFSRAQWGKIHRYACQFHPQQDFKSRIPYVESYGQAWCAQPPVEPPSVPTQPRPVVKKRRVYLDFGAHAANSHNLFTLSDDKSGPWIVWLFEPSYLMAPFNRVAVRRGNGENVPMQNFEILNQKLWECIISPSNPDRSYKPCLTILMEEVGILEKLRVNVSMAQVAEVLKKAKAAQGKQAYYYVPAAVGTEDKLATFHFSVDNLVNGGSSMLNVETHSENLSPAVVPVVDVASWMLASFNPEDHLLVKMDIEGAEFDVLPRLISTGAIKLIDEMKIEWHERFVAGKEDLKRDVIKDIAKLGIKVDGNWG